MRKLIIRSAFILIMILLLGSLFLLILVVDDTLRAKYNTNGGQNFVRVGDNYITAHPAMVKQEFPAAKDPDEFRIFVLGSSQAMGSPYVYQGFDMISYFFGLIKMPNEGGISTWIEDYLEKAQTKKVRVINAAKGGQNLAASVSTLTDIAEIGEPDLVILLSGNNERYSMKADSQFEETLDNLTAQYNYNMGEAVRIAEEKKISLYVLTVPTNIRDWAPSDFEEFNASYVDHLIKSGKHEEALAILREGSLNNSFTLFNLGKTYYARGDYETAKRYFVLASDLDKSFLRARSRWNNIVRNVSQSRYVRIIDTENIMASYGENGIPGNDMFLDYCHFNLKNNQKLAYVITKYILGDFFNGTDIASLDAVKLKDIKPEQIKTLLFLRKIAWIRLKYYTPFVKARDANTNNVVNNYDKEISTIDIQIDRLRSS